MKATSTFLCASVLLILCTVSQVKGILVTYMYIGDNYTQTNAPKEPGFTLSDHLVATITLDSIFWGTTINTSGGGLISSGPWQVGTDALIVTTDLAGTITSWGLSGALPGLDISTSGNADGSGFDNIFGDRPSGGTTFYMASVQYEPGTRKGAGWTMVVPEPSTFALLIVTVIGVGGWSCRRPLRKASIPSPDQVRN
jgi:hypothetical protein